MKSLIQYFSSRHLLTNVLFFGTILFAVFTWTKIGKEEMPEFASNWIRVNTVYPGAPAEDVELFVTKPIEEELKGVAGLDEVVTTSSVSSSSIRIVIDDSYPDKDEVTQNIKDAVLRANLPSEVRDQPRVRQFKSDEKAIMDIGVYFKGEDFLSTQQRQKLQSEVLSFESQILSLNEISSVDRSYYRKPELQILVKPEQNLEMQFSLSEIKSQIQSNNIRVPIGSLQDRGESKITAINELEDVASLKKLILRGNYEGGGVELGDLAVIRNGFERSNSIFKINGKEGVFLNIKKSVSTDILSAQAAVMKFVDQFRKNKKDSPLQIVIMDDESFAVTNRLNIISSNGIIGFILIMLVLCLFLDMKTGFWVAMGIPFSMAFTLIICHLVGYTVNNMTLAGIIIVLGIVVDDAIIVAENIARHRESGKPLIQSSVDGTAEVFKPIMASIITTCVAFVPLIFFEGFFGKLVAFIPLVVILMLIGSLFESLLILPAHLSSKTPVLESRPTKNKENWFYKFERKYSAFLLQVFKRRAVVLLCFFSMLLGAGFLYSKNMKFVMFPREESEEVFIKVKAKKGMTRLETAKAISGLEQHFIDSKEDVVAVRSTVGLSRRGGEVKENEASILVELYPSDDRKTPLKKLIATWEKKAIEYKSLESVRILKGRWGNASGSAVEIQIQENNEEKRAAVAKLLSKAIKDNPNIIDVEIEEPLMKKEFLFKLRQGQLIKFNVAPEKVTSSLRSFVEGSILYSINKGDEEVDVRLSVPDKAKNDLSELLNLRVENKSGQLIYLRKIVDIEEVKRPVNISRTNFKRTTMIYANLNEKNKVTPLQIAEHLEEDVFPSIISKYPTSIIKFRGEIEDSRESQGEFKGSVIMVVILIYLILVLMFNSLTKPFLVLSVVPFGLSGIVYVLVAHGMSVYGFFAAIGALGMIGVVINDAIVMIDMFENHPERSLKAIADISSNRLRPVLLTTLTTVVGILPTAYGLAGYDSMLAEMMLTMGWGLAIGTIFTLVLIPCLYSFSSKEA
jgi:multidrug efflux pump subunit AcrB